MTTTVGAYEAKTHLSGLLERVQAGETVTITRHGTAVARLVPVGGRTIAAADLVAAFQTARSGVRRGDIGVRELIEAGRA
jgi:prevent-host-death family protein